VLTPTVKTQNHTIHRYPRQKIIYNQLDRRSRTSQAAGSAIAGLLGTP
jgi:hypothetical protein